jgi:hypothetical protein
MNDDEIRALIRVAIEKHLGTASPAEGSDPSALLARGQTPLSFSRYPLPRAEGDSQCLIEPAVRCNHCGYCECHGH